MTDGRPIVIDTDPGQDDAVAILAALASPELDLIGITAVAGNVPVDRGTINVFRLLALRRPARFPVVAVGASRPLARPLKTAERHHGAARPSTNRLFAMTPRPTHLSIPAVPRSRQRRSP